MRTRSLVLTAATVATAAASAAVVSLADGGPEPTPTIRAPAFDPTGAPPNQRVLASYRVFRREAKAPDRAADMRRAGPGSAQFLESTGSNLCVVTLAEGDVPGVRACSVASTSDRDPPLAVLQGKVNRVVGAAPDGVVRAILVSEGGATTSAAATENGFVADLPAAYRSGYLINENGTRLALAELKP